MLAGMLVGLIQFRIWAIPISLGSGGGCLLSGLFFGWLHSVHPNFSALPLGASSFLRDFGLAVFVGIVGITADLRRCGHSPNLASRCCCSVSG